MFLYVLRGTSPEGRTTKPNRGGLDPTWITELNIATFSTPLFETVPIKLAGLYPEQLLIKFIL